MLVPMGWRCSPFRVHLHSVVEIRAGPGHPTIKKDLGAQRFPKVPGELRSRCINEQWTLPNISKYWKTRNHKANLWALIMCHGQNMVCGLLLWGMVIHPTLGIPDNGPIHPYYNEGMTLAYCGKISHGTQLHQCSSLEKAWKRTPWAPHAARFTNITLESSFSRLNAYFLCRG